MKEANAHPAGHGPHTMQCSEVWGGNDAAERAVMLQGLDAWVASRPCAGDDTGGDIHYLSSCGTGRIARILVADVCGHGAVVASLAGRLRSLMRRYINYVDQRRLVSEMNREFAALAAEGEEGAALARFATAVVVTLWTPSGEFEVTNAGHPPPLVYRAALKSWSYLQRTDTAGEEPAQDTPLGILDMATYGRARERLEDGDLLLVYTDAFPEAKSPSGRLLGPQGWLGMVSGMDVRDPASLPAALLARVREYTGGPLPDDDTTLLLIRPNGLAPRGSLRAGLRVTHRLTTEFLSSLLPGREDFSWPQLRVDNILGIWLNRLNRGRTKKS